MTIQAVFFDMGGTIETFGWTPELRFKATPGIRRLLSEAGTNFDSSDKALMERISSGLEAYHRVSLGTLEEWSPRRVWSEFILAGLPVDQEKLAEKAEEMMVYIETRYYSRALRSEVPEVLEAIKKKGLKIGLISNVNSLGQVPENLKRYGIREYFHPLVLSSEYGRRKPDPAIFHYAARMVSAPTSECLYIGDRIARDIVGARRAGFRLAVQIKHDFNHGEEDRGAKPDAVITKMTELLAILEAENKKPRFRLDPARQVRALLFDAGDILYHRPHRDRKFQAFLAEVGRAGNEIPEGEKKRLRAQAFEGLISPGDYRHAVLRLYGVTDPVLVERGNQAVEEDENCIHFFKGVRQTLKALKNKGYMLGIITDTANPIHVKLNWFESGGIGHVWDSIISSQDLGIQKPAPEIYSAALQQLNLSACQTAFIGHDVEELNGAHVVGMKTIAFNYDRKASADFYIDQFSDLLKVPILSANDVAMIGKD